MRYVHSNLFILDQSLQSIDGNRGCKLYQNVKLVIRTWFPDSSHATGNEGEAYHLMEHTTNVPTDDNFMLPEVEAPGEPDFTDCMGVTRQVQSASARTKS